MRAAIYTEYGPPEVLRVEDVKKPTLKNNEVMIQVFAATVNRTDCGFRSAKYFISRLFTGLIKPKYLIGGSEFAGRIVEMGENVTEYKVGDRVFGFDDVRGGAHAELVVKPSNGPIAKMPKGFDYQELAPAAEGATYALNILDAVGIKPGQKVLVNGASGAIGSAAVQILVTRGAVVTAVCGTKNVKLVKSLGAKKVIDYETEDFTKTKDTYEFIFDAVGKSSYGAIKRLLTASGTYYSSELGSGGQNPLLALLFGITGSKKVIFPIPQINKEGIETIARLIASGSYKPVVDRVFSLEDIVAATKYVETGQKTGNVVIEIKQ